MQKVPFLGACPPHIEPGGRTSSSSCSGIGQALQRGDGGGRRAQLVGRYDPRNGARSHLALVIHYVAILRCLFLFVFFGREDPIQSCILRHRQKSGGGGRGGAKKPQGSDLFIFPLLLHHLAASLGGFKPSLQLLLCQFLARMIYPQPKREHNRRVTNTILTSFWERH
jgi:hypothetical protein